MPTIVITRTYLFNTVLYLYVNAVGVYTYVLKLKYILLNLLKYTKPPYYAHYVKIL